MALQVLLALLAGHPPATCLQQPRLQHADPALVAAPIVARWCFDRVEPSSNSRCRSTCHGGLLCHGRLRRYRVCLLSTSTHRFLSVSVLIITPNLFLPSLVAIVVQLFVQDLCPEWVFVVSYVALPFSSQTCYAPYHSSAFSIGVSRWRLLA